MSADPRPGNRGCDYDAAGIWKARCRRYEQHMADNVPQELWPEFFEPSPAGELSDATIRAVIEAWERTGMRTELDGKVSRHVCDRVRDEIKAGEP